MGLLCLSILCNVFVDFLPKLSVLRNIYLITSMQHYGRKQTAYTHFFVLSQNLILTEKPLPTFVCHLLYVKW